MLSHLKGVVIEGNSAIDVLKPDVVVFVSGRGGRIKAGAERILRLADAVVFYDKQPQGTPEACMIFRMEQMESLLGFISEAVMNRYSG